MSTSSATPEFAARNAELNQSHAMSAMRARSGRIVNAIEKRRRRLVADRVRRLAPRVVVDVGCEDGWIAEAYVDAVKRVVLADLDASVLQRSALAQHPHVTIAEVDALQPAPLRDELGEDGADVIVLSALLEHLPDPAAALDALTTLLAARGRFVIYLPADGPILFAKSLLKHSRLGGLVRGLSLEPAPGHLHRFTRRDVAALLRPFGVVEELAFDPVCLGYIAVVRKA
ncbi:MAG: class I SAM-dependent methyltransferase [Planctomycetota bacterium]|nr:class I SAM-dependent methyltransferase [Planctomycetota bacterium]